MELVKRPSIAAAFLLVLLMPLLQPTEAQIGVCYGRNGNNLPSEQDVVNLYKSNSIGRMRIYDPDQAALQALGGSNIQLTLDVPNDSLGSLGSDANAAAKWVQDNVVPYASNVNFRYIAVGNEVMPSDTEANFVLPAMQNIHNALNSANLGQIQVSTAIKFSLVETSYPPSSGTFGGSSQYITPIINFLSSNNAPLLANIYPYISYVGDEQSISLDYALFKSSGTVVTDPGNGLQYQNLFDAMLDAIYAAVAGAGAPNLAIVVSESGWPSDGGDAATSDNAGTYYGNLIKHVQGGTPKHPNGPIETYLFAMFDENQKSAGVEQHYGLFTPDQNPKYQISFT